MGRLQLVLFRSFGGQGDAEQRQGYLYQMEGDGGAERGAEGDHGACALHERNEGQERMLV